MLRRQIVSRLKDYAEVNYDRLPPSILAQYFAWYFEEHQTQVDDFTSDKFASEIMFAMEILRHGNYFEAELHRVRLLAAMPELNQKIPDIFNLIEDVVKHSFTQLLVSIVIYVTKDPRNEFSAAFLGSVKSADWQLERAVAAFVTLVWQDGFEDKMATFESERIKVGTLGEVNFAVFQVEYEIFVNLQDVYNSDDPRDFQIQLVFNTKTPNAMPTIVHSEITIETALRILERNVTQLWFDYRHSLSIKYWAEDED